LTYYFLLLGLLLFKYFRIFNYIFLKIGRLIHITAIEMIW